MLKFKLLCLGGLVLGTSTAFAEVSPSDINYDALSLEDLLETPLGTGSFLELDLRKSPVSLDVIRHDQIEASGARHLGELLEIYVPGFQYMYNKWNGQIWGMRGVANDRNTKIIFCVNGLKQNSESRDGFFTEQELGLLGDIGRVEVLRGPSGLVYGAGAIAGVVNVVTRTPTRTMANVSGSLGYGFWREGEAQANVNFGQAMNLTLSLGARGSNGYGLQAARIYGKPEWPTPSAPIFGGIPSDGSPWSTPGDERASLDFRDGDFRLYGRFTRQQVSAGPYFVVDPWPSVTGQPTAADGTGTVAGQPVSSSGPYGGTESYGNNRRLYRTDNLSLSASYRHAVGPDEIVGELAWFGYSESTLVEGRAGYALPNSTATPAGVVLEAFGERRYLGSAQYLFNRIPGLQSAFGLGLRVDDLGADLSGQNHEETELHQAIANTIYTNISLYTENYYTLSGMWAFDVGLRLDKHTRTDVVLTPKLAVIFTPNEFNSIKLFVQGSANNGTVDNYEFNRNSTDASGRTLDQPQPENPRDPYSAIRPGVSLADLRSLQPETALSVELASTHRLGKAITILPSVSYTRISNMFAWNQDLLRVINAPPYDFISLELEARYESALVQAGISHVYQRVVRTSSAAQQYVRPAETLVSNGDGTYRVVEIPGQTETVEANPVRDQVTRDGVNFLNLSSHTTKLFLDIKPLPWLTLDTNLRVLWGLVGRQDLYTQDQTAGYSILDMDTNAPIVKWGVGAVFALPYDLKLAVHGYDLLGSATSRNAIRWQQMAFPDQRSVSTVDQRTVNVSLEARF